MTRTAPKKTLLTLLILATGALTVVPAVSAQEEQAQEDRDEKTYRFEFEMDDDLPMKMRDFAMHFDPPDLSELEDLHLKIREPLHFLSGFESGRFAEEQREIAALERESRELARRARDTEGGERAEIEADLREKLEEIFDKKMELRRERVTRLEEELREERENLRRRTAARDEMIERRLRRLMGDEDVLEW